MISQQTTLTAGSLVLEGAFGWLLHEDSPFSKQELTLIRQLSWSEHKRIWGQRISRTPLASREVQLILDVMTRLDTLNLDYFTWQKVCNADLRYSASDWNLSGSKSDQVSTYCGAKNREYIQAWLLQLPIAAHESVFAVLQSGTVITEWSMVCRHWETFSANGNRLNVADDDPRWQIFFHPDELIFFLCTEGYRSEKNLSLNQFVKPSSELQENIREANIQSSARSQQWVRQMLPGVKVLFLAP